MKTIFKFTFTIILFFFSGVVLSQNIITESINLNIENNKIVRLENRLLNTIWLVENDSLFKVNTLGVSTKLKISKQGNDQIKLELIITNISDHIVNVDPVFPIINGIHLSKGSSKDLYYLFPKEGGAASNIQPVVNDKIYSSFFPLQFMDIYDSNHGGFYVMTNDTTNQPKRYFLTKKDGKIDLGISFRSKPLAPGESWLLPSVVIGMHKNDWHDALFAYKEWVKTWYRPYTPRKQWFQDIYNFRQVFLHTIFGEVGAWSPATKNIDLISKIEADKKAFGGVDYVHIFDWMRTPKGRIVDYDPWSYLGGYENLKNQIKLLQQDGIRVGLYHEGYIMNKKSKIGLAHGEEWQQLNTAGKPYTRFGEENYYPCPLVKGWQDYLSDLVKNSSTLLGANGVYIDQYGFCWQYGCHNPAHGHDALPGISSNLQVKGEATMMKCIKDKLSKDQVLYIEETPTDVYSQYIDGSFSYAVQEGRQPKNNNPSCVNLFRFVFPDYKLFEILKCDLPFGNDTDGVKHIFFNGEGIWLEGPLSNPDWFTEDVRTLIRKTHSILLENKDAFRSNDAIPLVPTLQDSIFANYFPSEKKNVWTLYNSGIKNQSGVILKILHKSNATYFDLWNKKELIPLIKNEYAFISVTIQGKDVGCVIQNY